MTFLDTEMKELVGRTQINIHNTRSLIRALKYVSDIFQTEEAFTVEEYKHTHTHNPQFYQKTQLMLDIFTGKPPWRRLLFDKVASLDFITVIWSKKDSTTEVFEISEDFLRDIFVKHFLVKLESIAWQKYIELAFNSKGDLYYLRQSLYSNTDTNADTTADVDLLMP